jgi:hypothetical protein
MTHPRHDAPRTTAGRRGSKWALLALWLLLPCCANTCAGTTEHFAEQRVGSWEFRAPPEQTWREVREVLAAEGYEGLSERPPLDETTTGRASDLREVRVRFAGSPSAYTLEVTRRSTVRDADGGARVFVDATTDRRLLWRVVQRVEPARASEVRRAAEVQSERSRAAWSACDHCWESALERAAREQSVRANGGPKGATR